MGGTIVFVHGTGVRRERLDELLASIRERIAETSLAGMDITEVYWAQEYGVDPELLRLAAPPTSRRAVGDPPDPDETLWDLLLSDPLIELAAWAADDASAPALGEVVPQLNRPPDARSIAEEARVSPEGLETATTVVFDSSEFADAAIGLTPGEFGGFAQVVARAIVATLMTESPSSASLTGQEADELVEALTGSMAPDATRAIGLRRRAVEFLVGRAFQPVVNRRASITERGGAFVGDIALYQRRSNALETIKDVLVEAAPPIVALGHSLGGIMLVDLLSRGGAAVDLLVTVGSQSPALLLFDALDTFRLPSDPDANLPLPLPAHFPTWLNIFDERDLLSFSAQDVFHPVRDVQVDNGVGFPFSHSAYWRNPDVYRSIAEAFGSVSAGPEG